MTSNQPKSSSSTANATDAIALLTKDHRDVKALFNSYQNLADSSAPEAQRLALALEICEALTVHATVEEEIFYPAMREAADDAQDQLDEAEVEHQSVKELVEQIKSMEPTEDLYDAKVKVLGEYVDHHVAEEEGEMFPKAKSSDMDLDDIGQQIKARKEELQLVTLD